MGSLLRAAAMLLFWTIGLLGFAYFGPPQWTSWVSNQSWVQDKVFVRLDAFFTRSSAKDLQVIAKLESLDGELSFRPSSELVFLRARLGQRFSDGTVVSSGSRSRATLILSDESKLTLAPNSTLLLEIPEGEKDSGIVNLRVVQGQVAAQKDRKSELRLKLLTPKGQSQEVSQERIAVFAPRVSIAGENVVTRDARVSTGPELVPIQEFIGKVQDLPVEVQKETFESFEEVAPAKDLPVLVAPTQEVPADRVPAAVKEAAVVLPKPEIRFEALDLRHLETFELRPVRESRVVEILPTLSESIELKELPRLAALSPTQLPEIPIQPIASELLELKEAKPVNLPTPAQSAIAEPIVAEPVAPNLPVAPVEKPVILVPLAPERATPDLKPLPAASKTPETEKEPVASKSEDEESEVIEQEVVRRPTKTQFEKPPEGNDLSRSLYMERVGKRDVARRLRARAITKEGYSNNFEIVRAVLEDQVNSALESSDCEGADSVLANAKNAFPRDASVDRWIAKMRNRVRRQCKNL